MTTDTAPSTQVRVEPLTPDRWPDLETLFSEKADCNDCWCMFWRLGNAAFNKLTTPERHDALKARVDSGHVPGMLAYVDGQPAGWCALGPRDDFDGIERSSVMKRIDDRPVWSLPCFYISKHHRSKGVMHHLLEGAISYAASQGATLLESYPSPSGKKVSAADGYKGLASVFSKAGFVEVKPLSTSRVLMRYSVNGSQDGIEILS
jgi:GNAT superfamily N-acetyltransferase